MSRAKDLKTVKGNIKSVASLLLGQSPDIALFQEVDKDAGRSYRYDEYEEIAKASGDKANESDGSACDVYATNLHTGWLLYPPTHPIGQIKDSGILTLSRYNIDSAERRSLPVDESFIDKFFDLDRCFTISRIPVEEAGELVLINVHLSAYDAGLKMRGEQMKMLADVMKAERDKGNWVIAGGDWNQCFPGTIDAFKGRMETPKWATEFDEGALPEGFSIVAAGNADTVATCRDTSIPWTPGINYETTIDGWVVSDNVSASSLNIDTVYEASDHNPVTLTFTLKS
jgi:endonuclease/exonuclease/phosphatase family metal-dependent hydrolase